MDAGLRNARFQFHYGTIKSFSVGWYEEIAPYFNSTMVRLKASSSALPVSLYLFQFHYGTIKRQTNCGLRCSSQVFQFHYGTIKSPAISAGCEESPYFNSTMVRLKVTRCLLCKQILLYFNSTMVRLKAQQGSQAE